MSIPGQNILGMALQVIQKQEFIFFAFLSRKTLPNGNDVPTYAAAVRVTGSVQPAPRQLIMQMGLDLQKTYFNFFLTTGIIDVTRDVSGDQFEFKGRTFQCLSATPWRALDGWDQVLTVEVPGQGGCEC